MHVFAATVRENLLLADGAADDERLHDALEQVGAAGWVGALPAGLDTRVGDGAHPLTAAQAQQLALARVQLRDPRVVVLDRRRPRPARRVRGCWRPRPRPSPGAAPRWSSRTG
ncbi:hypothetical protein [Flexivirga oryzae]|uniref:ABC-type multidrug transport system fused ATPase/permease subunit n=1 Tax=Flexivirga oryzae TaxID=1794944 RepID=A0A839N459_9MICO|nr:hypothetical protein [Flexivirga oryzae]MBB2890753.1 ABC-type multidrug transport system fused ATPase/permease subunit [Flexivirga oryzae]